MESKKMTKSQKKHVRIQSLAEKYECSRQYVRQILDGNAPANSALYLFASTMENKNMKEDKQAQIDCIAQDIDSDNNHITDYNNE